MCLPQIRINFRFRRNNIVCNSAIYILFPSKVTFHCAPDELSIPQTTLIPTHLSPPINPTRKPLPTIITHLMN